MLANGNKAKYRTGKKTELIVVQFVERDLEHDGIGR